LNESAQKLSRQKLPTIGLVIPVLTRLHENLEAQDGSSQSDKNGHRPLRIQFKEDFAEDIQKRWDMLPWNALSEMRMSAFLDPRTKDFDFVSDKDNQRFLEEMQEGRRVSEKWKDCSWYYTEVGDEEPVAVVLPIVEVLNPRKKKRGGNSEEEKEESDISPVNR